MVGDKEHMLDWARAGDHNSITILTYSVIIQRNR